MSATRRVMFLSLFRCTVCALCAVACFGGTEEWNWNFVEKYGGRMLSVEPPIAVLENFLTRDELEHLKNAGSSFLKPAETSGKAGVATRTSFSHFLTEHEADHSVVKNLRRRLVAFLRDTPLVRREGGIFSLEKDQQFESLQIQRYLPGERYDPHFDFSVNVKTLNFRAVTILMYLSTIELGNGGETIFPLVEENMNLSENEVPYAASSNLKKTSCSRGISCDHSNFTFFKSMPHCCCSESLKVRPIAGRSVVFFPRLSNGESDKRTWHGACPVVSGTKFTAQQWIHSPEIARFVTSATKDVQGLFTEMKDQL
mgnify:FL=1